MYIQKYIDYTDFSPKAWEAKFPKIEEVQRNPCCLLMALEGIEDPLRQAIIQQYNEILIYNAAPPEFKNMLAPQLRVEYFSKTNVPMILYPKMQPLITTTDDKLLEDPAFPIYLGWHLNERGLSIKQVEDFFGNLEDLCDYFDLVQDDIVNNYENIGYDECLGLRILDYGLCEGGLFCG